MSPKLGPLNPNPPGQPPPSLLTTSSRPNCPGSFFSFFQCEPACWPRLVQDQRTRPVVPSSSHDMTFAYPLLRTSTSGFTCLLSPMLHGSFDQGTCAHYLCLDTPPPAAKPPLYHANTHESSCFSPALAFSPAWSAPPDVFSLVRQCQQTSLLPRTRSQPSSYMPPSCRTNPVG